MQLHALVNKQKVTKSCNAHSFAHSRLG